MLHSLRILTKQFYGKIIVSSDDVDQDRWKHTHTHKYKFPFFCLSWDAIVYVSVNNILLLNKILMMRHWWNWEITHRSYNIFLYEFWLRSSFTTSCCKEWPYWVVCGGKFWCRSVKTINEIAIKFTQIILLYIQIGFLQYFNQASKPILCDTTNPR